MNVSDLWDWVFFWQVFRNFMGTASSFVMIPIAVLVVGMLITIIIRAVRAGSRG